MNKPFPRPLNVVSLFAGIGGFELAFRKINAKTILMCEIEPTAKSVLLHRLKNTHLVNDVCEIESLPSETDIYVRDSRAKTLALLVLNREWQGHDPRL